MAVIVDTSPGVSVLEAGYTTQAVILRVLREGAVVQLDTRARVVILLTRTGDEYALSGPASASVDAERVQVMSGPAAVRRSPQLGHEIRINPERVTVGGIALRDFPRVSESPGPRASEQEIAQRRPDPSAPLAARVAYALWLEEVGATGEAKVSWKALAAERPDQASLAARAR